MSSIIEAICDKYEIILASSSPRRLEILQEIMGFPHIKLMKPSFEEDLDKSLYKDNPAQYVCDTSMEKARGIARDLNSGNSAVDGKGKLVVCADTIIIDSDNKIHEKPKFEEVQLKNLTKFHNCDEPLKVITAVALINWKDQENYSFDQFHEVTSVYFDNDLPADVIECYVDSKDGLNVAGGFKIQSFGGVMIDKIEGDYYNVVGLPLNKTFKAIYKEVF